MVYEKDGKKVKEECCSKVWDLGDLEIRRGLDLTKASVAHRFKEQRI